MRRGTLILFLLVPLLWGSTWLADQAIGEQAAPLAAGALRFLLAAVVLLPFLRRADLAEFRSSLVLSVTMMALPYALLVWAGRHGSAGWTPLVYAALPWMAAGGNWRPSTILAIGATFVILNGSLPLTLGKALWALPIFGAVGSQAFALHYVRRCQPRVGGIALQFVLTSAALAALSLAFDPRPRLTPAAIWPLPAQLSMLVLGTVGTALPYWFYYRLLRDLRPEQAAATEWLQFVVTVLESALLFRQRPGWAMFAGLLALCVFAARTAVPQADEEVTIRLTPER